MTEQSAHQRLCQIQRHLATVTRADSKFQSASLTSDKSRNMSSQAPHKTLLIPGPIENDDAVLQAMSLPRSVYMLHAAIDAEMMIKRVACRNAVRKDLWRVLDYAAHTLPN